MLLWGAFAFLAVLVPDDLARAISGRLVAFRVAAVALAVATTAVALPVETAAVADGWSDAIDPATVGAVLCATSIGAAWAIQALAAILLLSAAFPPRRRLAATAAASGLLLATLALTGHAAMQEGWIGIAHRLNDAAHVLAAGAWLGSLVPLLLILGVLDQPHARGEARVALRRFSVAGHAAVAAVIATGLLNTAMTLGRWPMDWTSPYQALLAAKLALVALMVGLAVANRYLVVPRLKRTYGDAHKALRAATVVEVALGLGAIACVSVFGLLDPS